MQRYQLDLSDFFSDHRQKVFVGKRDKWKPISCLVKHIEGVFGLNGVFITNQEGVLFLEDDSLDVIRESDLLRVHASNHLEVTRQDSAPKLAVVAHGPRASGINQNGKRKRESDAKSTKEDTTSSSDSESNNDDGHKKFTKSVESKSVSKLGDMIEEISSPKRKCIHKKNQKKTLEATHQKEFQRVARISTGSLKIPEKFTDSQDSSDSESNDDDQEILSKLLIESESISKKDESIEGIPKPKRKRIRKRKSKKKLENMETQQVVVKTYGKGNVPAILKENGTSATPQHIHFNKDGAQLKLSKSESEDEEKDTNITEDAYRNLNKETVARVVKAVLQPSEPLKFNEECPPIPDYVDDLNVDQPVINSQTNRKTQKQKKSLKIKQELIKANTDRAPSPTWDSELDQAKENFLTSYTGQEIWNSLQEALDNFPTIAIPSANDIIAYRLISGVTDDQSSSSYLAFVEWAGDGDSDDNPALKLKLRQLNTTLSTASITTCLLDQLKEIRLVATYQP